MTKTQKIIKSGGRLKSFFYRRQHPIRILTYIAKYLWLLLIPLAKYLIAVKFDFQSWVKTNWVDILTLSVIIGYGFLRWVFVYFEIEDDCIIAHTGYFGVTETRVYFSEMSTLSLCQGYFFRAIHACTLYIDTDAKSIQQADITLDLNRKQAFLVYELATKKCKNKPKYIFKTQKKNLIIFSLLFSSALSGVILALTFIYEAYRIVGREAEEEFLARVNSEIEKLTVFIPKYLIVLAAVVAGGWLISFVANLMRHWNFSCTRCADMLIIESGKGTKRQHVIMRDRINYVDYRQSLLMKIFKIRSVSVQCTGYGKRRLEISALVPITTNEQVKTTIKMLMPGAPDEKYDVRTGFRNLFRYVIIPLIFCFVPYAAYQILSYVIPQFSFIEQSMPNWRIDLRNLAVLSTLPMIWLIIVKICASFSTAIGFDNNHCTLSYSKFYQFHTAVVNIDRISKITIKQTPFQRYFNGMCDLYVYVCSETVSCHVLKGLNYDKVTALLKDNGYPF